MQIDLSMYPEDNAYVTETHLIKEEVETVDQLAYLFHQFALAIGFSYVDAVVFFSKGELIASSDLI